MNRIKTASAVLIATVMVLTFEACVSSNSAYEAAYAKARQTQQAQQTQQGGGKED